jgi:hypothetical protein
MVSVANTKLLLGSAVPTSSPSAEVATPAGIKAYRIEKVEWR